MRINASISTRPCEWPRKLTSASAVDWGLPDLGSLSISALPERLFGVNSLLRRIGAVSHEVPVPDFHRREEVRRHAPKWAGCLRDGAPSLRRRAAEEWSSDRHGGPAIGQDGDDRASAKRHKVSVTDGPFAETKEQLGGFYLIEARDLNDAIRVASKIPSARVGSIEVRPIMELCPQ
jgi:hypothetical protein